jgi:hypothetical protein
MAQAERDIQKKFIDPPKMVGHLSKSRRTTSFKCRITRQHNIDHHGKITLKTVFYFFGPNSAATIAKLPQ